MTDDVVDLLVELVAIDSTNPSLGSGGTGESAIATFVAGWARDAGLSVEVVEQDPGRPSVLVRGGEARGDAGRLLLCGHLDTVGPGGMADPWTARRDGDRLSGRGTYDMKAGLAAALVAARDVVAAGIPGEVVVAAVADEEHASLGMQQVLAAIARSPRRSADAAIVLEPTELALGIAHRGFTWSEVEVRGRAAHGSRPHLGEDAILAAGPVLVALRRFDRELRDRPDPVVGPGNLHASLVHGGTEESTIPDRCVVTLERRTLPGETAERVEADLEALLDRCRAADPSLSVTQRTTLSRPPFRIDADHALVATVAGFVAAHTRDAAEVGAVSYWADSALVAAEGIPTLVFGPAGDGAHADDEWVDLPSVATCREVLVDVAGRLCDHHPGTGDQPADRDTTR